MVMMMETMVVGNQIEKSNLMVSWMKDGVKSSPKEEFNSSMKINEIATSKNKRRMLLTSCFCFTILTTNPIIIGIKIVS